MSTVQMEGLWAFIQSMSLSNRNKQWLADRLVESKVESVSPSADPWFEDQDNRLLLDEAIQDLKEHPAKAYTIEDIDQMLGYDGL